MLFPVAEGVTCGYSFSYGAGSEENKHNQQGDIPENDFHSINLLF